MLRQPALVHREVGQTLLVMREDQVPYFEALHPDFKPLLNTRGGVAQSTQVNLRSWQRAEKDKRTRRLGWGHANQDADGNGRYLIREVDWSRQQLSGWGRNRAFVAVHQHCFKRGDSGIATKSSTRFGCAAGRSTKSRVPSHRSLPMRWERCPNAVDGT